MPALSASFNSSLFKELIIFIINSSPKTQSLLMLFHPRSRTVPETSLLRSVPACPVPPCLGSSLPLWTTPESSWPARPPLPVKCSPSAPRHCHLHFHRPGRQHGRLWFRHHRDWQVELGFPTVGMIFWRASNISYFWRMLRICSPSNFITLTLMWAPY